jgi:1-aminocyclopropane-1-carboxylate deaminase/D-cysteine desulfhydrase-like pyridoxal-dependent ACC family enzyme/ribosomal protein S18 acetylase RimI-like enzyme
MPKTSLNLIWPNKSELSCHALFDILKKFGDYLPVQLSYKVNLEQYAQKIIERADILFAYQDQDLIGILILYANDFEKKTGHIPLLSISPHLRGRGVGKAMMSRAIARCRSRNITTLSLEVHHENRRAIDFYQKIGFARTGIKGESLLMSTLALTCEDPTKIAATPLEHHPRLASRLGLEIDLWIKRDDLYPMTGGGIKSRKIKYILQHVIRQEHDVIVTNGGPQSNHARATAIEAARIGISCHIIIVLDPQKNHMSTGNILLMKMAGATIEFCRKEELAKRMDKAMEEYKCSGYNPFYLWGGGHHITGTEAFIAAAFELQEQMIGNEPDYLVIASGTGTTQAGLAIGFSDRKTKVFGISVAREAGAGSAVVESSINEYYHSRDAENPKIPVYFYDDWHCGGYEETTPVLLELIMQTAQLGLILDPTYSGKGWLGLNELINRGIIPAGSSVVFWHTGGLMNLQDSFFAEHRIQIN